MRILHFSTIVLSLVLITACSSSTDVSTETVSSTPSSAVSSVETEPRLDSPSPNSLVQSPLLVVGFAPNTWFFEGSLPVQIVDADGNVLVSGPAMTEEDWMSDGMHPFQATLEFQTSAAKGFIVVKKDNPSGDPERDAEIRIPVRFQ